MTQQQTAAVIETLNTNNKMRTGGLLLWHFSAAGFSRHPCSSTTYNVKQSQSVNKLS